MLTSITTGQGRLGAAAHGLSYAYMLTGVSTDADDCQHPLTLTSGRNRWSSDL